VQYVKYRHSGGSDRFRSWQTALLSVQMTLNNKIIFPGIPLAAVSGMDYTPANNTKGNHADVPQ
jgi:hypothetical protein